MASSPKPPLRLDSWTQALLLRAERRAPARNANEEIARERLRQQLSHGQGLSYEVTLGASHGFAYLAQAVAPKLALFLREKKMSVFACKGVFVSLFLGEELHFIEAPVFFEVVREAEGLDVGAFSARVRQWEKGA